MRLFVFAFVVLTSFGFGRSHFHEQQTLGGDVANFFNLGQASLTPSFVPPVFQAEPTAQPKFQPTTPVQPIFQPVPTAQTIPPVLPMFLPIPTPPTPPPPPPPVPAQTSNQFVTLKCPEGSRTICDHYQSH